MNPELVAVYRRCFPLLVRKVARILGELPEAQDVAQEAFLRLHAASSELSLRDERAVMAWLYRTSTRLAIDRLRARTRVSAEDDASALLATGASPEHSAHLAGLWSALIRRAPEDELEAALLTHVDGLTQPEIAEVLGVHERSVRRLLAQFEERAARLRARSEA